MKLVFLHGAGSSSLAYYYQLRHFRNSKAIDLPGHSTGKACNDIESYLEWVRGFITARRYKDVVLCGHSMGGAIGLMLAERGDLPLASFISVEGNLLEHDCGILSRRAAETPEELFVSDKFVKLLEKASRAEAADTRGWAKMAEHTDAYAFHRSAVSLVEWSDSGRLYEMFAALAVPKVYIYGERSANAEVIARLDGVHKIEIDDAGHFLTTDQSELFHETVARIIANG